jgi:NADH-quinone oxidoreductase subunit M
MPDLSVSERVILAPAIGLMFILGIYPQLAIGIVNRTVLEFVDKLRL